ncbi:MAG: fluoride efflux transporter CrcB [Gimesia sp.]|uniref:Fluoride-specific ion channel FluC n=1 Tax=Gimesia chilikensis TaxID=2605989 RepID=A0A517PSB3_9PLAN|nr:fluoride efflux transporter CrcB [Gimesia chilikensis]MBN71096.1 fluoride efflux transporter CrcB [Gimesia sp.]MCR9231693.1 fluoride efflux transporter CrcB [bacterium]QDT22265.1 Putative fluoride ion transporter CrcB [Gimesia chilikensis]
MSQLLAVGLGGFFGAIARYSITEFMSRKYPGFPAGTFVVNATGCLLIGILMAIVSHKQIHSSVWVHKHVSLFLITGMLGSLTTFSTFGHETVSLLRNAEMHHALINIAGNLLVGLFAVWLGWSLVMLWMQK